MPTCLFFFFQAEDGIRDLTVTGVQTCALPISSSGRRARDARDHGAAHLGDGVPAAAAGPLRLRQPPRAPPVAGGGGARAPRAPPGARRGGAGGRGVPGRARPPPPRAGAGAARPAPLPADAL